MALYTAMCIVINQTALVQALSAQGVRAMNGGGFCRSFFLLYRAVCALSAIQATARCRGLAKHKAGFTAQMCVYVQGNFVGVSSYYIGLYLYNEI
jgi:hypothetical protein